jgi:hypothetical protein
VLAAALAASVAGLAGGPAYASAGSRPVLSVGGKVGSRQVTDTGVLLETLVTDAGPAYPASLLNTKNELLRVTARSASPWASWTPGSATSRRCWR